MPARNGEQADAKPKVSSAPGKPVAASATLGAPQTRPASPGRYQGVPAKQSSQQARPVRHTDTPAFLAVSPTSPIRRPGTPPASGLLEEPLPAAQRQPDLNSPPSFKGFLTAKTEQEAAAEDHDSNDIWTPRNMALGTSYASTGTATSLPAAQRNVAR